MKLEKVSAIAEIVSSVAIVVTLIYLSIQTQQNSKALIAVSRQAILQADLDYLSLGIAYPEVTQGEDDRSPVEVRRQSRAVFLLRSREFAWFQYQSGLLDETTWESYLAPMNGFATADGREILENYRGNPEFKAYLLAWLSGDSTSGP